MWKLHSRSFAVRWCALYKYVPMVLFAKAYLTSLHMPVRRRRQWTNHLMTPKIYAQGPMIPCAWNHPFNINPQ